MSVVIVGGGWSGLAAAVTLSQQGQNVTLFEAAKQLGGRARNITWQGLTLDNGQHMMVGAYQTMLDMLELVGADKSVLFQQSNLDISVIDKQYPTLRLSADAYLPWSLSLAFHFLRHNSPSLFWQIIRLQRQISDCLKQADLSVLCWLQNCKQSPQLIRQLWEPLCLATLNTPIDIASAHVFATVIRDMFKSRQAAQLLIPKQPLGEIFPHFAAQFIQRAGGNIRLQTRISELQVEQKQIRAIKTTTGEIIKAEQLILATPPYHAKKLLADENFFTVEDLPITTLYLQYAHRLQLTQPLLGLSGCTAQWLFDRQHDRPGLIAVVISGPGEHEHWDNTKLSLHVAKELHQHFPQLPEEFDQAKVIREKQATFSCHADIQQKRPSTLTSIKGLYLAGDYVYSPYPATLESAMLTGKQAAQLILSEQLSR